MKLDINHWQMLKAIDDFGSLNRAATGLNLSQSALSHRLAEAERRLGGAFFHRQGRRLVPTPAGIALTQVAHHIVPTLMRAEESFVQTAHDVEHVVKIGVAAYHNYYWLPGFLALLKKIHKDIQIEVVASATTHPRDSILQAEVDLVMVPGPFKGPGLESMPLFKDELVLITALGHELSHHQWIKAEQLLDEDVLIYGRDTYPGFEYERFVRPAQITLQRVKVIEVVDAIVGLVSAGQGVSVLSRWAIEPSLKTQRVSEVQLGPQGLDLLWSCVCRSTEPNNSPSRLAAAVLQTWFKQQAVAEVTR